MSKVWACVCVLVRECVYVSVCVCSLYWCMQSLQIVCGPRRLGWNLRRLQNIPIYSGDLVYAYIFSLFSGVTLFAAVIVC